MESLLHDEFYLQALLCFFLNNCFGFDCNSNGFKEVELQETYTCINLKTLTA